VDVFTARPYLGNPVAVVFDADGLEAATMQRVAAWTNLSETTFVLRPTVRDADYRLRIFTPRSELPFAGHPTIGSAHAVLEAGIVPERLELRQECAAGLLRLAIARGSEGRRIAVEAPRASLLSLGADAIGSLEQALGARIAARTQPQIVAVGPRWLTVLLADAAVVRALTPDLNALAALSRAHDLTGVTVFALVEGENHDLVVRSFAPAAGVPEDPVCGSGNAAVGAWLDHAGMCAGDGTRFVASQGRELGRDGYVTVRIDPETRRVWIGGPAVTCIDGVLTL